MQMAKAERWLSVEEIAHHLGVSKETVYRWLEKQKVPAHRIGKLWKFKPSEVDQWVLSGEASTLESSSAKSLGGV
jgi:excisionase family DNA binding protein